VGQEDDFTRRFERMAAAAGFEAKCRLMRRGPWIDPDTGETYPPYHEYEARCGDTVLMMDTGYDARFRSEHIPDSFIEMQLECFR
jgi:hypothetical protein